MVARSDMSLLIKSARFQPEKPEPPTESVCGSSAGDPSGKCSALLRGGAGAASSDEHLQLRRSGSSFRADEETPADACQWGLTGNGRRFVFEHDVQGHEAGHVTCEGLYGLPPTFQSGSVRSAIRTFTISREKRP